ncbi:hypothetical protein XENOCAPTIV_016099, partial [Xenoophorus captivus]
RWEGGDPGVSNQKTPTTILLTPDRKFHSFGYAARDFYHDLDPNCDGCIAFCLAAVCVPMSPLNPASLPTRSFEPTGAISTCLASGAVLWRRCEFSKPLPSGTSFCFSCDDHPLHLLILDRWPIRHLFDSFHLAPTQASKSNF